MIRKSILLAIALAVALPGQQAAPVAAGPAPPGFVVGISPQTPADEADYALMAEAGIHSLRLPLGWPSVEAQSPYLRRAGLVGFRSLGGTRGEIRDARLPVCMGDPLLGRRASSGSNRSTGSGRGGPGPRSCGRRCAAMARTEPSGERTPNCRLTRSAPGRYGMRRTSSPSPPARVQSRFARFYASRVAPSTVPITAPR